MDCFLSLCCKFKLLHNKIYKEMKIGTIMENAILLKLGLSENEIKVYLELLKIGPSLASLIARITKLHRTHVYDIFNGLLKKGIISFVIRENRKYFQANKLESLSRLIKEKEDSLEEQKGELFSYINELRKLKGVNESRLNASIYQGKEGMKAILEDVLESKEDYLVLGYAGGSDRLLPYYLPNFHKRRIKFKIKRKILMNYEQKGKESSQLALQEVRYLPEGYGSLIGQIIYSDKVALIVIHNEEFIAFLIEDKDINLSFRKQFELLWKNAKG